MPKTEFINDLNNKIQFLDKRILNYSDKITSQSENLTAIRSSSSLMMQSIVHKQVLIEVREYIETLKIEDTVNFYENITEYENFYKNVRKFTENQAKEYFNLDISRVSTSDPWVSFNNSLKLFYYENFYSELEKLS